MNTHWSFNLVLWLAKGSSSNTTTSQPKSLIPLSKEKSLATPNEYTRQEEFGVGRNLIDGSRHTSLKRKKRLEWKLYFNFKSIFWNYLIHCHKIIMKSGNKRIKEQSFTCHLHLYRGGQNFFLTELIIVFLYIYLQIRFIFGIFRIIVCLLDLQQTLGFFFYSLDIGFPIKSLIYIKQTNKQINIY